MTNENTTTLHACTVDETARGAGEDVPAALVEKAAEAILDAAYGQELPEAPIDLARAALAAVLPDIQAQALEDAADGMHSAQHTGCFRMTCPDCREFRVRTDVRAYLRARAARLTTTTERTTDA